MEAKDVKKDPLPTVAKKARTIRNPYGRKVSSLPPISTKPLYGLDNSTVVSSNRSKVDDADAPQNQATTGASKNIQATPSTTKDQDNVTTNPGANSSTYSGPASISLQPWQRLPSNSLSFGSAEILSVTECIEHAEIYHQHGRSIRCSGIIEEVITGHPTVGKVENAPPPELSVRLSDPLQPFGSKIMSDSGPAKSSGLWVVFMTPEQTRTIRTTSVGGVATVLGELCPLASSEQGWALRVRLCLPVPPSANLALQWEALLLRRRHLLSNTNVEQGGVLRVGCGPPPYA